MGIRGKIFFYVVMTFVLVFVVYISLIVYNVSGIIGGMSTSELSKESAMYAQLLKGDIEVSLDAARTLSQIFSKYREVPVEERRGDFNRMLKSVLSGNKDFVGVSSCWETDVLDGLDSKFKNVVGYDSTGRFIPYWYRDSNGNSVVEPLLDYNVPGAGDYYLLPKKLEQEVLIEPYYYKVNGVNTLMTSTMVPVMDGSRFVGVVGVDTALSKYQDILNGCKPFGTGYGFLISSNGTLYIIPVRII